MTKYSCNLRFHKRPWNWRKWKNKSKLKSHRNFYSNSSMMLNDDIDIDNVHYWLKWKLNGKLFAHVAKRMRKKKNDGFLTRTYLIVSDGLSYCCWIWFNCIIDMEIISQENELLIEKSNSSPVLIVIYHWTTIKHSQHRGAADWLTVIFLRLSRESCQ